MNTQNYASLEASKRLHDARIILDTEEYCYHQDPTTLEWTKMARPSMAEVWRELKITSFQAHLNVLGETVVTVYKYPVIRGHRTMEPTRFTNINSTDALIDLLIWVSQSQKETA